MRCTAYMNAIEEIEKLVAINNNFICLDIQDIMKNVLVKQARGDMKLLNFEFCEIYHRCYPARG